MLKLEPVLRMKLKLLKRTQSSLNSFAEECKFSLKYNQAKIKELNINQFV